MKIEIFSGRWGCGVWLESRNYCLEKLVLLDCSFLGLQDYWQEDFYRNFLYPCIFHCLFLQFHTLDARVERSHAPTTVVLCVSSWFILFPATQCGLHKHVNVQRYLPIWLSFAHLPTSFFLFMSPHIRPNSDIPLEKPVQLWCCLRYCGFVKLCLSILPIFSFQTVGLSCLSGVIWFWIVFWVQHVKYLWELWSGHRQTKGQVQVI